MGIFAGWVGLIDMSSLKRLSALLDKGGLLDGS